MRSRFDEQLSLLNKKMIEMGTECESIINLSVKALIEGDTTCAETAKHLRGNIDHMERDIESICIKLLLQQQPVAKDLRQISAALKMVTDMERIGDQAADISELTIAMSQKPYIKNLEHIRSMAKETMIMVIDSLQAFVDRDLDKAHAVIEHDDVVDDLFMTVKKEIIEIIHNRPDDGDQATDLLMVAKYFERIGDHAANIAEWVIFSITGER